MKKYMGLLLANTSLEEEEMRYMWLSVRSQKYKSSVLDKCILRRSSADDAFASGLSAEKTASIELLDR